MFFTAVVKEHTDPIILKFREKFNNEDNLDRGVNFSEIEQFILQALSEQKKKSYSDGFNARMEDPEYKKWDMKEENQTKECEHKWKSGGTGSEEYLTGEVGVVAFIFCEKCGEIKSITL